MGRAERAKSGLWHGGGYRPYGYNYIDGHLVVNDIEAVMVREVFDLFLKKNANQRHCHYHQGALRSLS